MSSRKKLTISLVAVVLVVAAVVVAVVSVLAAQTQVIQSGFTVRYNAGKNVAADVSASYVVTTKKAVDTTGVDTTGYVDIGSLTILGSDEESEDLKLKKSGADVTNTPVEFSRTGSKFAIVFKFTFTNNGSSNYTASLTPPTFTAANNLKISYKAEGSSDKWTTTLGNVQVSGKTAGAVAQPKTYYVQVEVVDVDLNVNDVVFNLDWTLTAV